MKSSLSVFLPWKSLSLTSGWLVFLYQTIKKSQAFGAFLSVFLGLFAAVNVSAQDNYSFTSSQSALRVTMSVPNGASNLSPGSASEVVATVVTESWDTYLNTDTGDLEVRNFSSLPVQNAAVNFAFTSASGAGTVSTTDIATDSQGIASTWVILS